MPVRVYIKHYIDLDSTWLSKEDFEAEYADDLPAFKEFLMEDVSAFLEASGVLEEFIQSAEWY